MKEGSRLVLEFFSHTGGLTAILKLLKVLLDISIVYDAVDSMFKPCLEVFHQIHGSQMQPPESALVIWRFLKAATVIKVAGL
jgi:hypothetical protein